MWGCVLGSGGMSEGKEGVSWGMFPEGCVWDVCPGGVCPVGCVRGSALGNLLGFVLGFVPGSVLGVFPGGVQGRVCVLAQLDWCG